MGERYSDVIHTKTDMKLTSFYSERFLELYLNIVIWRRFKFIFAFQIRQIFLWIIWRAYYSSLSKISFTTCSLPKDLRVNVQQIDNKELGNILMPDVNSLCHCLP